MSLNFEKYFILYTFSIDLSYVVFLTQKQAEDIEIPISFMRSTFKGAKLNYYHIDKHAYTIYKSVKHFRPYLLKSRTKVIVPYATIRNVLIQTELGEKHARCMIALQE